MLIPDLGSPTCALNVLRTGLSTPALIPETHCIWWLHAFKLKKKKIHNSLFLRTETYWREHFSCCLVFENRPFCSWQRRSGGPGKWCPNSHHCCVHGYNNSKCMPCAHSGLVSLSVCFPANSVRRKYYLRLPLVTLLWLLKKMTISPGLFTMYCFNTIQTYRITQ